MTRMLIARILVVLATLFAVVGLLAGYVRYQALDNETFSNTAADLIADDEVRDSDRGFRSSTRSIPTWTSRPRSRSSAACRSEGARRADRRRHEGARRPRCARVLERPRAQELWVSPCSTTHEQLLRVLDDDLTNDPDRGRRCRPEPRDRSWSSSATSVAIVGRVAERLPADAGRIEIMDAEQLATAQDVTRSWTPSVNSSGSCRSRSPRSRSGSPATDGARSSASLAIGAIVAALAGPRRPQRRRQLHRRQPRQGGVGAAGRERLLGNPHRASPRRRPNAPRSRDRAPARRLARRARREGNGASGALGAVARAAGDRLRRRGARCWRSSSGGARRRRFAAGSSSSRSR